MTNFLTLQQLYSQPEPSLRFLIEGLLPSSGLTFAVAKPKVGKSTLVRQAIVAVATGGEFLGYKAESASVLYYAIEERASEVARHFREMNLPPDAPIELYVGELDQDWLSVLKDKLAANPNIKLVVIDPILLAINVRDANDYTPMMKALEPVRTVARDFEVAIVCVHHSKKSVSADPGDNVLGSTAIRASADATWQIIKTPDGTRSFQTEMRYGIAIPPTNLIFDEDDHTSRLGLAEAFVQKREAARTAERIERDILARVTAQPMSTREEILSDITGNAALKHKVFRRLENEGVLKANGAGVRGAPLHYDAVIPVEGMASSDKGANHECSPVEGAALSVSNGLEP
jgi:RecA-family ATPase